MSRYNTIKWHRVGEIEILDELHNRRRFLYETPVLRSSLGGYLDYPIKREMGLSISLFQAQHISRHYPELLAKQAMWFVKNLCEKTDLVERGISLRLGLTEDMGEICVPYLNACSFPMNHVDWLEPHENGLEWFSKIVAMQQEGFDDIEKVLHMDLNFLFGAHSTHTPTPIFKRILNLWQSKPIATSKSILQARDSGFFTSVNEFATPSSDLWHEIVEKLADYTNNDLEDELAYWESADAVYVFPGALFGLTRETLASDLPEEIKKIMMIVPGDEIAFSVYFRANQFTPDSIDDIFPAFKWSAGKKDEVELYAESPTIFSTSENTDFEVWMSQHQQ